MQSIEQAFLQFYDNGPDLQGQPSLVSRLTPVGVELRVKLGFSIIDTTDPNQNHYTYEPFFDTNYQGLNAIIQYVDSGRFEGDAPFPLTTDEVKYLLEDLERIKKWFLTKQQ